MVAAFYLRLTSPSTAASAVIDLLVICPAILLQTGPHFRRLNDSVVQLLDDFSMVTACT